MHGGLTDWQTGMWIKFENHSDVSQGSWTSVCACARAPILYIAGVDDPFTVGEQSGPSFCGIISQFKPPHSFCNHKPGCIKFG